MILSYHPCYEADTNVLCAGREPDAADRTALREAAAVILPQGCRKALYNMARENCSHVFPNYDARFQYPGKTGQARLFEKLGVACPQTWVFQDSEHFIRQRDRILKAGFPLVLKLDWGGEGDTVFKLKTEADLQQALDTAAQYERTGQKGFVIQAYVPHGSRSLRVAVIGKTLISYWRIQERPSVFGTSVAKGARIDAQSDPGLRRTAEKRVEDFGRRTGVDLAGIDLIFQKDGKNKGDPQPLLLEINYFFGRTGLGGSERFYTLFQAAVDQWLDRLGLATRRSDATVFPGEKR